LLVSYYDVRTEDISTCFVYYSQHTIRQPPISHLKIQTKTSRYSSSFDNSGPIVVSLIIIFYHHNVTTSVHTIIWTRRPSAF